MTRVLVVDDEPQYGVFLKDCLAREGHEVKTATNPQDAMVCGESWKPDVLIADWMLRGQIDGLHVANTMRAIYPALQTILITGYPSPELRARAKASRVFSFIEKPFSLAEVAGEVRRAASAGRPQFPGEILIVSEAGGVGPTARDILKAVGYKCHLATTAEEARRVARENVALAVAILDCLEPKLDHGVLAEELQDILPALVIVGSSERDDATRFAELGIARFMPRFWEPDDLRDLLVSPIHCAGCCAVLPLRIPLAGDAVHKWKCVDCGSDCDGVLLEEASPDLRSRVRLA
ncbi:MAG TPA: response regulator [Pirellulales bacterium]|jgi:DNA-binding NtrC family response regulator